MELPRILFQNSRDVRSRVLRTLPQESPDAVEKGLPKGVKLAYARSASGSYCGEAIEAYEKMQWKYIVVACKTARLVG